MQMEPEKISNIGLDLSLDQPLIAGTSNLKTFNQHKDAAELPQAATDLKQTINPNHEPGNDSEELRPRVELATRKSLEKAMVQAGVDRAYLPWCLKNFSIDKHLDWDHGGYYISGIQGCGKSCLAAAIVADRMRPSHPATLAEQKECLAGPDERYLVWMWPATAVRWFNARELCDYLRESWGQGGEDKAIRALLKYQVIVIDDIGTERGTTNQDAVNLPGIRRVIDKCGHNGIGLIITTNFAISELNDPRLASRLSNLDEIELPEVDLRWQAKRQRKKIKAEPSGGFKK